MSPRILAIAFATIMLVGAIPPAGATHIDPLTPDVPVLPKAQPTQDCIPTGVTPELLARANMLLANDPAFFRNDVGVPSLCLNGGPVNEYQALIRDLDIQLERLRNASRELQRQVDGRLEATLPESQYPNDLVQPRTTLLKDEFDGRRIGGFGDWLVVSDGAVDPLWNVAATETPNGTRTTYRFGDDAGYERGAHQWLVSPEIDLTALTGNKTVIQELVALRDQARSNAYVLCNTFTLQGEFREGASPLFPVCGRGQPGFSPTKLDIIVEAYEMAFDETIGELPVMKHGAVLNMTYRLNFAPGEDGVRMWIYSGDRQPDRRVLFDQPVRYGQGEACPQDPAIRTLPQDPVNVRREVTRPTDEAASAVVPCSPTLEGATIVTSLHGMGKTRAFANSVPLYTPDGLRGSTDTAFTGNTTDFVTVELNLTDFMEERIWILFEVKTLRNDRGVDIFNDVSRFARQKEYGFELDSIRVEGDGYHRNMRLKDIGATFEYQLDGNSFGDVNTTRTTLPPGNQSIVAYVHNAGDFTENATFILNVQAAPKAAQPNFRPAGAYNVSLQLVPDEVRKLVIPWSQVLSASHPTLREGYLYQLSGTLNVFERQIPPIGEQTDNVTERTPSIADPNATRARPANAAGLVPGAGNVNLVQLVRAATDRTLTASRADGSQGAPIEFCSSVDGRTCEPRYADGGRGHYAGRKGEPRTMLVGVRNAGNAPQDVIADLIIELDGVAKPDVATEPTRKEIDGLLPGENRVLTWNLVPTEPGAYRIALALTRADGVTEPLVERRLFVQRSTGLICVDIIDIRECGPSYMGDLVPELKEENVTASLLAADGTLYVATEVREAQDNVHSGMLAARDPVTGGWTVLANLSATRLNATFGLGPENGQRAWGSIRSIVLAPNGTIYMVGDNSTALVRNQTGVLSTVPLHLRPIVVPEGEPEVFPRVDLKAALWHNGTVVAGGSGGIILWLNESNLTQFAVKNTSLAGGVKALAEYTGAIHDIARAPNGHAYLVGAGGVVLYNDPKASLLEWTEAKVGELPLAWSIANRTLYAATARHGPAGEASRFYIVGDGAILVNRSGSTATFQNVTLPAPVQGTHARTFVDVTRAASGELLVLDSQGRIASCERCASPIVPWTFPELPLPPVLGKGATHPALATHLASDGVRTLLLGEAGMLLSLEKRGVYDDLLDWTTVPATAARDGGVIQTLRSALSVKMSHPQSFLGVPRNESLDVAQSAERFRVFLNHSVAIATEGAVLEVRLMYQNVPNAVFGPISGITAANFNQTCQPKDTGGVSTVCNDPRVRHKVATFTKPTPTTGWEALVFDNIPAANGSFFALELFAANDTRWAIDDIHLQGWVNGAWQDVILWRGPSYKTGEWYHSDVDTAIFRSTGTAKPTPEPVTPDPQGVRWEEWTTTFDVDTLSPWHVASQYADRPVFAANNEVFPSYPGGNSPRLLSNWDSRLLSPVIDLGDAYNPVISFEHTYAFRLMEHVPESGPSRVRAGDGGLVEIQYLRQGADCGAISNAVTCGWSRFFPVRPDADYPGLDRLGYDGYVHDPGMSEIIQASEPNRIGPQLSFWGRIALPDDKGEISSPRDTSTYEQVTITLANTTCTATQIKVLEASARADCVHAFDANGKPVPVNLSGRQIRVAFHLMTVGPNERIVDGLGVPFDNTFNHTKSIPTAASSYSGEGWYITDFKVLGAPTLGVDLRATNMTFRVGYDVANIGVGPGTVVPVNVTVENRGTFDVLGYTGELRIERVTNRALKLTQPVETITLPQQAVLDAGKSVNHTFLWNVPAAEGAEYALTFRVIPIGIDRDEDFLDNEAGLGTPVNPIPAKTVRRYNTEFLVSPENATIDITRYMPMYINNTGNVPLEGFTVERRISVIGRQVDREAATCAEWRQFVRESRTTAIVECRVWNTSRPAPAGTLSPLTAISDEVSPTADLFWKAPERASFLVSVNAKTGAGQTLLQNGADRRVSSFATFLFDDVEGGARGEAQSGSWIPGPGWNVTQPGFRSTDAYIFGDASLGRYPSDANATMVTPTVDIGTARTAGLAFYHKYNFENGFDGGVVEASADGGKTWTTLAPSGDRLTSALYNETIRIQASSPIHPTGDPEDLAFGFTSNSSLHPASVDGWVLSEFDLTSFPNVTQSSVAYEAYSSIELQSVADPLPTPVRANIYSYEGCGAVLGPNPRCWEMEDLSATIVAPTPKTGNAPNTFWWSGSASRDDDGVRVHQNQAIMIPVDLSAVASDQVVTAEWWEYAARFNEKSSYLRWGSTALENAPSDFLTASTYVNSFTNALTTRYNLGQPDVVETKGKWYRMRADLTPILRELDERGTRQLTVGFSYAPVKTANPMFADGATPAEIEKAENSSTESERTDYGSGRYDDDPGFAIDGFKIVATRIVRGQPVSATPIVDEATAWSLATIKGCPPLPSISTTLVNCLQARGSLTNAEWAFTERIFTDEGRTWSLVEALPSVNATWRVVTVKDHEGYSASKPLPTGDLPKAWWTGEPARADGNAPYDDHCNYNQYVSGVACPQPGTESRLITPAFDLGRIAGNNAKFEFTHRYAFAVTDVVGGIPLASGGVVEIQEYDAQAGTWSPWKQIYSRPGDMTLGLVPREPGIGEHRGGYTAVTTNASAGNNGVFHYAPPFENVVVQTPKGPKTVQFLYSGTSSQFDDDGEVDGWIRETYDVSQYLGKRVRFAFHSSFSHLPAHLQGTARLPDPDGVGVALGGWWISDIAVVGDVIVGSPVQLRWRAGSDGNVENGAWLLDDIGLYGARYRNNVGIFVDETTGRFGGLANTSVDIPITLRNLGNSVRRDLVIELVETKGVEFNYTAIGAPQGGQKDGSVFRMEGFTLGPGQSVSVTARVKTPRDLPTAFNETQFLIYVKEKIPGASEKPYVAIVDNEVQGLLAREIGFRFQGKPLIEVVGGAIDKATPKIGEPVALSMRYHNPGYGPATLNLSCSAQSIKEWERTDHRNGNFADTPIVLASYPCEHVSGSFTVAPKATETIVYRVVPTTAGYLSFKINGSVVNGSFLKDERSGIAVGVDPLAWRMPFDSSAQLAENFTGNAQWEYLRGNAGPGALLLGIPENDTIRGRPYDSACGGGVCRAVGPPVDLHNFSNTSTAFLSFWHMERLAKHDGAQVKARVLINEQRPTVASSWAPFACVLRPVGGYEGVVRQVLPQQTGDAQGGQVIPGDLNPAFNQNPRQYHPSNNTTGMDFFVSPNGRWEDQWSFAVFDLTQPCEIVDQNMSIYNFETLVGRTVRFEFEMFPGAPTQVMRRGAGHGWLIDDITVGPYALEIRPTLAQRAPLVDNTTKGFNLVINNRGSLADRVVLSYDAGNSSAPRNSVLVPTETIDVPAGGSRIVTTHVTLPRDPSLLPTDFKARILAKSVLDGNAGGAATLELAFGPRKWAELAISVEKPAGIVQEGTEAFIPITIENNGLVESVPSRIRIVDTWANGRVESVLELPSVPSYAENPEDSTRVFEFRWRPEAGSVGPHTLTFEADPDVLGEEYTRTNNLVTMVVPVSDLLIPDLHVANLSALTLRNSVGGIVTPGIDADVARYEVTAGEVVSFEIKVANKGRAGATNVDVRAFIGALSLPPKTIPYIAPGTESVVVFNWLAQKGEHEVELVVRSEQVELSTANNRYPGVGVTILTVKGYEIEIDIPDLVNTLEPGTTVDVAFSVRNAGNAGEDLELRATTPSGMRLQLPREGFFLRAGETYSDTARLILDADAVAGQQFITIAGIARENPLKVATGRAAMQVNATYAGSVAAAFAAGAPPTIVLRVELVNEGNSLEPWTVVPQLPAGWSSKDVLPAKVVVPAHGKTTLELRLNVPESTAPGERVIAVKATMPNGEKREGIARVAVLALRSASIELQEVAPKPDRGQLTIPVVVENQGNVRQPFAIVMLDAPKGIELRVEPSHFDLPPGGKAVAQLSVRPDASIEAGSYAVSTYTLFEGVAPETAEGRSNMHTLRVPIVRQDLRLGALEYAPRAGLDAGDRVTVKVAVTNGGLTEVLDVPVHLYVDDVFIEEFRIARLAAGSRVDATFNWTALPGPHTLTAVVDPYADTVDGDRADNAVSALASVGTDLPAGGVAAGRADTPGLGLMGLLAALGVALLATRREGRRRPPR